MIVWSLEYAVYHMSYRALLLYLLAEHCYGQGYKTVNIPAETNSNVDRFTKLLPYIQPSS